MTDEKLPLLIFILDEKRYALSSFDIKRIIRIIEITTVPNPEKNILGIINLQGEIIPVIDICSILGIKPIKTKLEDLMVVVEGVDKQSFCFVVDKVNFIEADPNLLVSVDDWINNKLDFLDKILKDPDGPIHILNINNIVGQLPPLLLEDVIRNSTGQSQS